MSVLPQAWSDGQRIKVVMHEQPSGGGYTLSVEDAEALLLQLQSAVRSAKASAPIIQRLLNALTDKSPEINDRPELEQTTDELDRAAVNTSR